MATSTGNLYLDPSYTDGINGSTHSITGEVLEFGVNAFNNQTQANNALVVGGTIFVTNWGTAGLQAHTAQFRYWLLISNRTSSEQHFSWNGWIPAAPR